MPWRECCQMDERLRLVARLLDGGKTVMLCRKIDISPKTFRSDHARLTGTLRGSHAKGAAHVLVESVLEHCARRSGLLGSGPRFGTVLGD